MTASYSASMESATVAVCPGEGRQRTVCLAMIVKDEAHCIAECLNSVKDFISHWVICDTGSTDNTPEVIQDVLRGVPGELHHHRWENFASNRNAALELARGRADYIFVIDADDHLVCDSNPFVDLSKQCYWVEFEHGGTRYRRIQLFDQRLGCRYVGALHEALHMDGPYSVDTLPNCHIKYGATGSRSRDPEKFLKDAQLLETEVARDPGNPRNVFYLAQSYKDAGMWREAMVTYDRRAEMGGWEEEVYYSLYQSARMRQALELPWETVLNAYLAAYQCRPTRLEAILDIARHYRDQRQYALGYVFSRLVLETPYPSEDLLFVERGVYDYALPLEYGICCYWLGRHAEALRVNDTILATAGVPENYREAARSNRQFSVEALGRAG
jgi:glycosyltransferase involved in cell wall biosynthesis